MARGPFRPLSSHTTTHHEIKSTANTEGVMLEFNKIKLQHEEKTLHSRVMIATVAMVTFRSGRASSRVCCWSAGRSSALQFLKKKNVSCSLNGPNYTRSINKYNEKP